MASVWAPRSGEQAVAAYLRDALESGKATHAYLIVGDEGSGKEELALKYAAAVVADGDESEFARACRLAHPDVHILKPDGVERYTVDAIREGVVVDASLTPARSQHKAYILMHADRLNDSSANALLKTLEEPPGNVVCVLLAEREEGVLPTVRSRCEVLSLPATCTQVRTRPDIEDMLRDAAAGCGTRVLLAHARRFCELAQRESGLVEQRQQEQLEREKDFLQGAAAKEAEKRTKRLVTAALRDALSEQLDEVDAWLRTRLVAAQGACELADGMLPTDVGASTAGLLAALAAVKSCRERITYNVTPQLAIEAMFMEIREALCQR